MHKEEKMYRRKALLGVAMASLFVVVVSLAHAQFIDTLRADADAWVDERNISVNYGNDSTLWVVDYSFPSTARTYVHFNVSSIPSKATILEAVLKLFYFNHDDAGSPIIGVYKVDNSWTESGITWSNQPNFSTLAVDSVFLGPVVPPYPGYVSWDGAKMASLVQGWVGGTIPNYGVVVKAPIEFGTSARLMKMFKSREAVTITQRPILIVQYITATGVQDEGSNNPSGLELEQNFPNPFNPSTMIRYTLPKETNIGLTIYNIKGQLVCKLVGGRQSAGSHIVHWNGKDEHGMAVSSGIYIYQLNTPSGIQKTRKMLLLK